jgi:MFS family permease
MSVSANRLRPATAFLYLGFAQFVIALEMASVFPLGPAIAARLSITDEWFLILNAGYFFGGVGVGIVHRIMLRTGYTGAIRVPQLLAAVGCIIVAAVPSPAAFLFGRALLGFALFASLSVFPAYVVSVFTARTVSVGMGTLKLCFAAAVFAAPFLATRIVGGAGVTGYYLVLAAALLVLAFLSHTLKNPETPQMVSRAEKSQSEHRYPKLSIILMAATMTSPVILVAGNLAFHLGTIDLAPSEIETRFGWLGLGSITAGCVIILLSGRSARRNALVSGFAIMVSSVLFLRVRPEVMPAIAVFGTYLGMDMISGVLFAFAAETVPHEYYRVRIVSQLGVVNAIAMVGLVLVGSFISARWAYTGAPTTAVLAGGIGLVAAIRATRGVMPESPSPAA